MTRLRLLLAVLMLMALAGCKEELYSSLTERQANQMLAVLVQNGIPARKSEGQEGAIALMVDRSRFADAIALLNARGLPGQQFESLGDVFQKEGLVSSPVEERARFIYALSQELSRTVAEIDGVLSARIHVVLPESDMLGRDLKPSSASVAIRHDPRAPIEQTIPQIKQLVANSIEGLLYDNVSVVTFAANPALHAADSQATPMRRVAGVWTHTADVWRARMQFGLLALLAVASVAANVVMARRLGYLDRFGADTRDKAQDAS